MKSLKSLLVLLAVGLVASPAIQAQDQSEPSTPTGEARRGKDGQRGPGAGPQGRGQMMNPEARIEQLDRAVGLTPEQKTSIAAIYANARDEAQASRGSGDPQANREKMQQTLQATRGQVMSLLTPEQQAKFEAMPQQGGMRGGPQVKGPKAGGGMGKGPKADGGMGKGPKGGGGQGKGKNRPQ